MNQVVITSICNTAFIPRLVEAYKSLKTLPDFVLFVLDRCDDNNAIETSLQGTSLNFRVVKTDFNDDVFAAGRPRDFGISYLEAQGIDYKHIVFLDGDCMPSTNLFGEHARIHRSVDMFVKYPVLVNSMRIDILEDGRQVPDARIQNKCVFQKDKDIITVFDKHLYVDDKMYPACVGCNVSLNKHAIQLARFINKNMLGVERVFAHVFDGQWGGEDPYLSATLFRAGALCVNANPSTSWVLHCYHSSSHRNNNHVKHLIQALGKFNSHSRARKLVLPATTFTTNKQANINLIDALCNVLDVTAPEIVRLAAYKMRDICTSDEDRLLAVFCASRIYGFNVVQQQTSTPKHISTVDYNKFFQQAVNMCFELRDFNLTESYDHVYLKPTSQEQYYHNSHGMFR